MRPPTPVSLACHKTGHGPPLVLVHGSGADHTRWTPVLARLAARFTVYALDRRGHGASPDRPDYRIEDEFEDLCRLLAEIGAPDATMVGHSYGALCALGAAARRARLARLVLYEPPLPASAKAYCPPGLIETMRAALGRGDPDEAAAAFATAVLGMTASEIERRRRLGVWQAMAAAAPVILRELESVARYAMQASRFAGCAVPTLLLVGADSAAEYHATAAALGAVLPNARVRLLGGQGHRAIDQAPELLAAAILEFVAATAARQEN